MNEAGIPLTRSIVKRIECELVALVRNDVPEDQQYEHRASLIAYDYQVAMSLNLNTKDAGGISPSLSFPYAFAQFVFDANFTFSQSREDSLTVNMSVSMRELANKFKRFKSIAICPVEDTNLAGDLGIKRSVSAALGTRNLATTTDLSPSNGEFSGTINFVVTKNLTGAGPTWTLRHFKGPGPFLGLSEVNNDKLSFAFATGKLAGKPFDSGLNRANQLLNQQLANDLVTQLSGIRTQLQR